MFSLTDSDVARFWVKVALPDENGCMLWTGAITKSKGRGGRGYASMWLHGGPVRAHRIAAYLAHGTAPEGADLVAHACRNRHCVAPSHLRWATTSENVADRVKDGTTNQGERSGSAKLTTDDVLAILLRRGDTRVSIARDYGVSEPTINDIFAGRTWNHVTGLPRVRLNPRTPYAIALAAS